MSDQQQSAAVETCPFCRTEVKDDASACVNCGARKGTAAEKGILGRFMIWANTRGVILILWLIVAPGAIYHELSERRTDWMAVAFAAAVIVAGWWVNKWTEWLWVKVAGRMSDPVWYR